MFLGGCSGALEAPSGTHGSCTTVGNRFFKLTLPLASKLQTYFTVDYKKGLKLQRESKLLANYWLAKLLKLQLTKTFPEKSISINASLKMKSAKTFVQVVALKRAVVIE